MLPARYQGEGLYLQAGTFPIAASAEQLQEQLEMRGYSSVLHSRSDSHLVLLGPFPDQFAALNYRAKLQQDGFESFIARLSDEAPAAIAAAGKINHQGNTEDKVVADQSTVAAPARSIAESRSPENRGTQIFLQLAAFQAKGNALSFAAGLAGLEHKPFVQDGADGWFRVVLGPFAGRESAVAYRERLKAKGRDSVLRFP
jgi:cell division protein FtsN